jgi:hypothetical protein
MLLSYIVEHLIGHIFDIFMWLLATYGLSRGDRGWLVIGVIVALVLIMSYVGQFMGGITQEGLMWMLISAAIGGGVGLYFGRRSRRRLRQPTDAGPQS